LTAKAQSVRGKMDRSGTRAGSPRSAARGPGVAGLARRDGEGARARPRQGRARGWSSGGGPRFRRHGWRTGCGVRVALGQQLPEAVLHTAAGGRRASRALAPRGRKPFPAPGAGSPDRLAQARLQLGKQRLGWPNGFEEDLREQSYASWPAALEAMRDESGLTTRSDTALAAAGGETLIEVAGKRGTGARPCGCRRTRGNEVRRQEPRRRDDGNLVAT